MRSISRWSSSAARSRVAPVLSAGATSARPPAQFLVQRLDLPAAGKGLRRRPDESFGSRRPCRSSPKAGPGSDPQGRSADEPAKERPGLAPPRRPERASAEGEGASAGSASRFVTRQTDHCSREHRRRSSHPAAPRFRSIPRLDQTVRPLAPSGPPSGRIRRRRSGPGGRRSGGGRPCAVPAR